MELTLGFLITAIGYLDFVFLRNDLLEDYLWLNLVISDIFLNNLPENLFTTLDLFLNDFLILSKNFLGSFFFFYGLLLAFYLFVLVLDDLSNTFENYFLEF